jgi:hypothetical protein
LPFSRRRNEHDSDLTHVVDDDARGLASQRVVI